MDSCQSVGRPDLGIPLAMSVIVAHVPPEYTETLSALNELLLGYGNRKLFRMTGTRALQIQLYADNVRLTNVCIIIIINPLYKERKRFQVRMQQPQRYNVAFCTRKGVCTSFTGVPAARSEISGPSF